MSIPQEAEEIHVHIELPSGKRVWWPATVEDVTLCEDKKGVLAYASVVFHASFQYPVERCNAEVLSNHTIRTESRTWVESTWKRPDDHVERDVESAGESESKLRTQEKRQTGSNASKGQSEEVRRKSQKEDDKDFVAMDSESTKAKKKRKVKRPRTSSKADKQSSPNHPPQQQNLVRDMEDLRRRLVLMERKEQMGSQCNHMELINERVHALRASLGDEILRHCTNIPRPGATGNNSAYAHVFSRGAVKYQTKIDYKLFAYALDHIESSIPYGKVLYKPTDIESRGRSVRKERHVIFKDAAVFFDWLAIPRDINRKAVLVEDKNQTRTNGHQYVRIMGGGRVQTDNADAKVEILVGRSCGIVRSHAEPTREHSEEPAGRRQPETCHIDRNVECIAYASSHCEEGGDVFADYPEIDVTSIGELTEMCIDSTFSISWNAIPPLKRGQHAITPHFTEGVQLGWLTVRYPYVLVRGHAMCSRIRPTLDELTYAGVV